MRFSTFSTILAVVLGASAAPASELALRQAVTTVTLCTDKNKAGACLLLTLPATNECFRISDGFAGFISSVYVESSAVITLFENFGCSGRQLDYVAPGINNLEDFGGNDLFRAIKANFR